MNATNDPISTLIHGPPCALALRRAACLIGHIHRIPLRADSMGP